MKNQKNSFKMMKSQNWNVCSEPSWRPTQTCNANWRSIRKKQRKAWKIMKNKWSAMNNYNNFNKKKFVDLKTVWMKDHPIMKKFSIMKLKIRQCQLLIRTDVQFITNVLYLKYRSIIWLQKLQRILTKKSSNLKILRKNRLRKTKKQSTLLKKSLFCLINIAAE